MATGPYLALVLHAHLPSFARHPENERHLEELWLCEALVECYLPLLDVFDRLAADGVPFGLTMSVTPCLAAMLKDDLLRSRFDDHIKRIEMLADSEMHRLCGDARFAPMAAFYRDHFQRMRGVWDRHGGDVVTGLVGHWDAGRLELLTCSATHCYLPGLLPTPAGIAAQIALGARGFAQVVGRAPMGAWLAECAYDEGLDRELARSGIRFSILDTHGLLHARPRPPFGAHAPICSPHGVAFFARDAESSRQVRSRDEGYRGDAYSRDLYRDIGFDLPVSDLNGEAGADGSRLMTGLKYFRITGQSGEKHPDQPGIARQRASEHAETFVFNRAKQLRRLAQTMAEPPIVVAPYDAELYGHGWFEGPVFLESVFRRLRDVGGDIEAITLREYLERHPVCAASSPSASSCGAGGYGEVGVGAESAWIWRHVHHATRYVKALVDTHRAASGRRGQALDQLVRELLRLQSNGWPFIHKTGTATCDAAARIGIHVRRVRHLGQLVEAAAIGDAEATWLDELCARDNFLAGLRGDPLRNAFDGP